MRVDSVRLFPPQIGLADMRFEDTGQGIIRISPEQLPPCYALLHETFHTAELNSLAEMQADLSTPASIESKEQFIILTRLGIEDQNISSNPVVSLIAGCHLALPNPKFSNQSIGFIEYLVTNPTFRHLGHASAMLSAFEQEMIRIANSRQERLCLILGEVEPDFIDFKVKRGYHQPKASRYAQPPIAYNENTYLPISAKLPKILMVKSWIGAIEADLLCTAVQVIFEKRYVPKRLDVRSARKVMDYIHRHVYIPFFASLQVDRGFVVMN